MKLYHGSQEEHFVPAFGLGNDSHDYGRGFYTTADRDLGLEWAVGQQASHDGWLHVYEADLSELKVFDFAEVGVLAWMAELMKHRKADDSPRYRREASLYKEKFNRRDDEARRRMVSIAFDPVRNPLIRTFDELLKEGSR